jgi:hypothetical protein
MTISWLASAYLVNPYFFATVMNEAVELSSSNVLPPRRMEVNVFADSI